MARENRRNVWRNKKIKSIASAFWGKWKESQRLTCKLLRDLQPMGAIKIRAKTINLRIAKGNRNISDEDWVAVVEFE